MRSRSQLGRQVLGSCVTLSRVPPPVPSIARESSRVLGLLRQRHSSCALLKALCARSCPSSISLDVCVPQSREATREPLARASPIGFSQTESAKASPAATRFVVWSSVTVTQSEPIIDDEREMRSRRAALPELMFAEDVALSPGLKSSSAARCAVKRGSHVRTPVGVPRSITGRAGRHCTHCSVRRVPPCALGRHL